MFKWPWTKKANTQRPTFPVVLVTRTDGKKRGIHSFSQQIENVVKVEPSLVSPYIVFDFADGTRLSIHHDRLLEWRSHLPQVK